MKLLLALTAAFLGMLAIPASVQATEGKVLRAKAKLVHLRGRRFQVRVMSTVPTGGYSKRAARVRRYHCVDDCQPSVRVITPLTSPPDGALVTQALVQFRHRKSIRLPKYWKVVVLIPVDGKISRRIRLTERDAR